MLRSHRRITLLLSTMTMSLALVAGFDAAPATAAATSAPVSAPIQAGVSVSSVALPGGDRVVYQGTSGHRTYNVVGPDGRTVQYIKFDPGNGHVYVLPTSALSGAGAASLDIAQYDVPELSQSAATASKPAVAPRYPLHIVQINANDTTGAPAQNAVTILLNIDAVQRFAAVIPDIGGVARVAVPVGNYAIYTGFVDSDSTGTETAVHFVLQDDVAVPASGGVLNVTADESAANAQISAATPRPTTADNVTANIVRTDAAGTPVGIQAAGPGKLFISPEATPAIGKFAYQVMWSGENPAGSGSRYRYDLVYPTIGNVPVNEDFPVSPSNLATLHYALDTDASNTAHTALYQIGAVNLAVGGVAPTYQVTVPEQLTDYITAPLPAGFMWLHFYQPEVFTQADNWGLFLYPGNVTFAAGKDYWRTWAHGPLAPQVGQFTGPNSCYACASGTSMAVSLDMVTDSDPQTSGWYNYSPVTSNFSLYRNGQLIDNEPDGNGTLLSNVPQQADTYRAVYDVDASGLSEMSQSTKTHTDLSFVYNPAGDPNSSLPAEDYCVVSQSGPTACQILPMLNLNYQLSTDATNTSHGPSILNLTVGHASFDGRGSQAPAASAKVEVSFDGGTTWTSAFIVPTVRNHYLAVWRNTGAKGSTPWLRVTATDTIGGSITQTITNAYTIG